MTMTLDGQTYEQWLETLKERVHESGFDLELQRYHHHSWFSHGYTPDAVIDDMRETVAGSDG
jgi:hypothetical protein